MILLVETDNMAAKGASRKMASKAADMQELIRRLYRLAEFRGFQLRVTHTPGEKLDRPDQTSRGDSVEEPRVRLVPTVRFGAAERRWGPFTGFLSAKREIKMADSNDPSSGPAGHSPLVSPNGLDGGLGAEDGQRPDGSQPWGARHHRNGSSSGR